MSNHKNSLMSEAEFERWERGDLNQIGDYTIKPKRDFGEGFLIRGVWVKAGWIVLRNGVSVLPGAVWDTTLAGASRTVGKLMVAKGDSDIFHGLTLALGHDEEPQEESVIVADLFEPLERLLDAILKKAKGDRS